MQTPKISNYPANITREEFDITEPQRSLSPMEQSFIHNHRDKINRSTADLFHTLVILRNDRGISFPSKQYLQKYCGIKHHNTLNKHLAMLQSAGLIRIFKKGYLDKKNRRRWNWIYVFPMFRKWGATWDRSMERQERETLMGCGVASMAKIDCGDINRRSNKKKINRIPTSFPQPETLKTEEGESAVSPLVEDEKRGDPPKIPPLEEDAGKRPGEIERETMEMVEKLEAITPGERARTVRRDIFSLRKRFGELPVLAGVRCALASRLRILNPGGWIRSHLENGWLAPLVEQMNAERFRRRQREEEERRVATRQAEAIATAEKERREMSLAQEFVNGLPVDVVTQLRTEAERELDGQGINYPQRMRVMFIEAMVRNVVRKKFPHLMPQRANE